MLPIFAATTATAVVTWREQGSIAGPDWLPLAILIALVVATVAAAAGRRPPRPIVAGSAALALLAAWTAGSIAWSPSPSGARDEALLVALYAVVLLLPGLTLAGERQRRAAAAVVTAGIAVLGGAAALDVATSGSPLGLFFGGRLDFPVSYVNGCSALFVLAVWPAVALAARRRARLAGRSAAVAAAALCLSLAVAAQSKGTVVGLVVSAALVLGLSPLRLRLLPPLLAAVVPAAAFAAPLTEPYRDPTAAAAHGVGADALVAAAAAALLGAAYAAVDARIELSGRARVAVGRAVAALAVAGAVGAVAAFFAVTPHPGAWLGAKWGAFKHPETSGGATHLTSLGSNRYDFWRVALDEAGAHPLRGIGGRGFYASYLQHGRSPETPLRSHSLYLDTLAEEGVPGLVLLLLAIGVPLAAAARRLRRTSAVAAFGAATYLFAHAAVDWLWTIPVVGVPAVLFLGIGAVGDRAGRLPKRGSLTVAVVAVLLAVLAFAPPWVAYHYVTAAYTASDPTADLARARQLDPLSLDPDWAEWRLATTPAGKIAALERAWRAEPDDVTVVYQLGLALEQAGRVRAARSAFAQAERLYPRSAVIRAAAAGRR